MFGPLVFRIKVTKEELIPLSNFQFWKIFDHHKDIWANKVQYLFIEGKGVTIRTGSFWIITVPPVCFTSSIEGGLSNKIELASEILLNPEPSISIFLHFGLANKVE